jgi:hypothetical protein
LKLVCHFRELYFFVCLASWYVLSWSCCSLYVVCVFMLTLQLFVRPLRYQVINNYYMMVTLQSMRWERYIPHMRNQQLLAKFLVENLTGKTNLGNIDFVEGKIVTSMLKKRVMIKLTWFLRFKVRFITGLLWTLQWNL